MTTLREHSSQHQRQDNRTRCKKKQIPEPSLTKNNNQIKHMHHNKTTLKQFGYDVIEI